MDGVLDTAGEVQEHLSGLLEPPKGQDLQLASLQLVAPPRPLLTMHCGHSRTVGMMPTGRVTGPSAKWDCAGVHLLALPLPLLAVSMVLQIEPRHSALC